MQAIRKAIYDVVREENPMTVRQVFYRMVSAGVIAKTEAEYNGTIGRMLKEIQLSHEMPFNWIADNTRWQRKPRTYDSMTDLLENAQRTYRRAIWNDQDAYVEVWLEKESLAGVLYQVTGSWDVPLMVTRGYPSISFLHSAAEMIDYECKPCFLYYFGDHDPSGVDIPRHVEKSIRDFAPDADITFERVAVLRGQIDELKLPTRPTKQTDTRSNNFKGESVEVDAIPPATLRQMVDDCISQHIDHDALERSKDVERLERETLETVLIDPGTASSQEVAELFGELSELYRCLGGRGLQFTLTDCREPSLTEETP